MTFAQPGDADWLFYQQVAAAIAVMLLMAAAFALLIFGYRRDWHRVALRHSAWLLKSGFPIVMLLAAALPWPYSYYLVLRVVVFAYCAFEALAGPRRSADDRFWLAVFVVLALIYNPFFPSHLDAEGWLIINLLSAAMLVWHAWSVRPLPVAEGDAAAARP